MRLASTLPLAAPPELRSLAEDVFTAVATARFVTVGSVMAYAGPDGLTIDMIDMWCRASSRPSWA